MEDLREPINDSDKPKAIPAFAAPEFGESLSDNLKEFFRPGARGAVKSGLLINWNGESGGFWRNILDTIFPAKLPPLEVTSKAVDVPEIWSKNPQFTRVQALSIAFHVLVLVLLIAPLLPEILSPSTAKASVNITPISISPNIFKLPAGGKKAGGGGGGGEHNPLPASHGSPPKFDWKQFTPPKVKPLENPMLPMKPTVIGPPQLNLANPDLSNIGDPLSKVLNDSSGPGSRGGIGDGNDGGVGPGDGIGVGLGDKWGIGGGPPHAGTDHYGEPVCLYCPVPQYSAEAVTAKHQGSVTLEATITADGRAIDIHIVKGLGLGLDEKAIEAVRTWHFKPALGPDGRPATVSQYFEIIFRLY